MSKREFDYEITHVNTEMGYFEVRYVPKQENLAAVTRNVSVNSNSIEDAIEAAAPYNIWTAQEFLAQNNLLGQTGTITPTVDGE